MMAKHEFRHTDEYIWEWYQHFQKAKEQHMSQAQYCRENNLQLVEARTMSWRIIYRSSNKTGYAKFMAIAKEYEPDKMTLGEFAALKKVSKHQLTETFSHIKHLEAIERMKRKLDSQSSELKFLAVPPIQPRPPAGYRGQEPEIMPKQNDVELIISKGVKVVVSPEVGADKLIRIIELLKDL